jgi:RNAse (barnase) inhibitor barstar
MYDIGKIFASEFDQSIISTSRKLFDNNIFINNVNRYGYEICIIDGRNVKQKADLLNIISQEMRFPSYFGHNWDALDECLRDLSWLPSKGYIVQFFYPEYFLKNSPRDFEIFLGVIKSANVEWKTEGIKFLLILIYEKS